MPPTPYTLHPIPYTLHPTPYILPSAPYTYILHTRDRSRNPNVLEALFLTLHPHANLTLSNQTLKTIPSTSPYSLISLVQGISLV